MLCIEKAQSHKMKTVPRSGRRRKQWIDVRNEVAARGSTGTFQQDTAKQNTEDGMHDILHCTTEYLVGRILASPNPPAVFRLIRYLDSRLHSI